jgi:hypothetical protein
MVVVEHRKRVDPEPEPAQLTIFSASEEEKSPANT